MGGFIGVCLVGLTSLLILRWVHLRSQHEATKPQEAEPLTHSEELFDYFKEFVDRVPVPAFIKDSESSTIYVNQYYETLFGSGWVGKSVWDFFPDVIAQQMVDADQKALHSGTTEIFENVPVPDGTGRLFQTIKFPLYRNGEPVMLAGFGVDITQRHLAEASLEQMNAQLNIINTELECRNRNTQLMLEFSSSLQSCHTLDDIQRTATQFIPQLLPQYAGLVGIKIPGRESLQILMTWGLSAHIPDPETVPCRNCWLWKSPQSPWITQAEAGTICSYWHGDDPVFYNCVPIYGAASTNTADSNQITGMLHFHLPTKEPIPNLALQLAQSILAAINQTLINVNLSQSLHDQSIRDPLTNLFNRRYLQETLTRELARAAREKISVSLVLMDIDRFKLINDTYGHTIGDVVLQQFGQLLLKYTRQGDIACRYGGEEFVIVLPTATVAQAHDRAEEIRCAFAELKITCGEVVLQATLSGGIAAYPEHGLTDDAVFCAADAALYQAKLNGRNQMVISRQLGRSLAAQ